MRRFLRRRASRTGRKTSLVTIVALVGAMVPIAVVASAQPAGAVGPFQQGSFVSPTLEGCRGSAGVSFPAAGPFVCPDDEYTSGNLGKGWNELDNVPHRLTTELGSQQNATTAYSLLIAGDNSEQASGLPEGYDFISVPVVNTALSDASCTIDAGPQLTQVGITGGVYDGIYRQVDITQDKGTTCVFDYYMRLSITSAEYSGSSLQGYMFEAGDFATGKRTVPIPVKDVLPQELSKTMTATQDAAVNWSLAKEATPVTLELGDTCDATSTRTGGVEITVSWTKVGPAPAGQIAVQTTIQAQNPASRVININVSDEIRSGTTVLDTLSSGVVALPANSTTTVLTHTFNVPEGTTNLNDVATASYLDPANPDVVIPGNTTATASASVTSSGVVTNGTAVVTDTESLTGSAFRYRVDSVSGASGTFSGGYTPGPTAWRTSSDAPLTWTSGTLTASGSVTFQKTVDVTAATVATGSLDDAAQLNGSSGLVRYASASTALSSSALGRASVSKSMNQVFASGKTFNFTLFDDATDTSTGKTTSVTIPAGSTGPVASSAVTGLDVTGTYFFREAATAPFPPQDTAPFGFTLVPGDLSSCSVTQVVQNNAAPATARVQKITNPAGTTSWDFTLTGPNDLSETKSATAGAGYVDFDAVLDVDGGTYTITEAAKSGWDNTAVAGDIGGDSGRVSTSTASRTCSFTLNLTTDSGAVLSCTFTNTQRGTIIVEKQTVPDGATGSFTFTGDAAGTISDNGTITVSDLVPGTYTSTEADPTPDFDLTSVVCDDSASATPSTGSTATRTATFRLDPGETVKCTFTNTQRGTAKVVKTVSGAAPTGTDAFQFQLRQGATTASNGTVLESLTANAGNGGILEFSPKLVPGTTYQLCEYVSVGWDSDLRDVPGVFVPGTGGDPEADNTYICIDFTVQPGEQKVFSVDNTPPPGGMAKTIGFWKNHASCSKSNGKQDNVLDATLTLGAVQVGMRDVTTCAVAVDILDKRLLGNLGLVADGKKMASDPAFNVAAQLLAYRLNILAGAGDIPAANTAAAQAEAILDAIGWNGSAKVSMSKTQAAQLNALNDILDDYNNNTL